MAAQAARRKFSLIKGGLQAAHLRRPSQAAGVSTPAGPVPCRVEAVLRGCGAALVWVSHDPQQPGRVGGRVLNLPLGNESGGWARQEGMVKVWGGGWRLGRPGGTITLQGHARNERA